MIQGGCFGGGTGIAAACDVVIAADDAVFSIAETRWGLIAGIIIPQLNDAIGARQVRRYALTGERFDAHEARRIGLCHELLDHDVLWARAHALAGEIAKGSPESLQLTKRMLNETIGENLFTLLSAGAAASATARTTEAAKEGLAAFLEKREPQWK